MKRRRKSSTEPEEVAMNTGKVKERGGLCCPHCADSKYPCVNMERQMRRGAEERAESEEEKDK